MFLRRRPRHFQPPASKIFIAFQLINVKNCHQITNYQFNLAAICLLLVNLVGWLVEFWCTRSRDSAPLIKSRKFLQNIIGTSFLFEKSKKIKSRPPASFSEKKCLRNILLSFFGLTCC